MPAILLGPAARSLGHLACIALTATAMGLRTASQVVADDASGGAARTAEAAAVVDRLVDERLAKLAEEIALLESSRPRDPLLARRFTVETFLIAATLPLGLLGGDDSSPIDPCPLWRQDFRGSARPLRGLRPGSATRSCRDDLRRLLPRDPARPGAPTAITGEFLVELHRGVGGDDPVAVGGLVAVAVEADGSRSLAILATRCEPCLSPGSVDFPIVPECFLLEADRRGTLIAVLEPEPLSHREARRPEPPRLDQSEDLYDLLDGARPLVLGAADADLTLARDESPVLAAEDAAPSSTSAWTPPSSGKACQVWESRDETDRLLQRVSLVTGGDQFLELRVQQPPVEVEWTSGELYQLDGHRPDGSLDRRWLRPRGTAIAHPDGLDATFRFSTGSRGSSVEVDGEVTRQGTLVATLRWRELRAIDDDAFGAILARWRRVLAPAIDRPAGAAQGPDDRWRATRRVPGVPSPRDLDAQAVERDAARRSLRLALASQDADVLRLATLRHRRAIESDGLSPAMTLRSLEGLAESFAAVGDHASLSRLMGEPWSDAVAAVPTPELSRLLRERVMQGRWATALRMTSSLEARADLPVVDGATLEVVRSRLVTLMHNSVSPRPRPSWFEPPGRLALEEFVRAPAGLAASASPPPAIAATSMEGPR